MRHRVLPAITACLLCGVALAGCSRSDEAYTVGNPDNVVIENETDAPSDNMSDSESDDLVQDVTSTELPDYWPADFPLPEGAVIDNVIEIDDSVTVTWILPGDSAAGVTYDFSAQLMEAGYEYGESEGSDTYGKGVYSSETHTVDFTITPAEGGGLQLYVIYGPAN